MPAVNFQNIFDSHAKSTEKVWVHDRSSTVGASEAFQCLRKTWYGKKGWPKDSSYKESYGAIRRGDLLENEYVVPAVKQNLPPGAELLFAGEDQRTLVSGCLSATPDGLITGVSRDALSTYGVDDIESDCFLLEIKSIDPRATLTEEKAIHRGQVGVQFGLIHETTNHRPEYGVILYVNASFVDDIKPFVVKRDPGIYAAARQRADTVFAAKRAEDVPAEGKITGDCQYCPYQDACALATVGSVPTKKRSNFTPAEERELEGLVIRRQGLKEALKDIEKEEATATEALKQKLRDLGTKFAKVGSYSVSYTSQQGRKSYDHKAMEQDGIDLSAYEKQGAGFEKLTVKHVDE